jgi:A/G-specific adenine glycosylase
MTVQKAPFAKNLLKWNKDTNNRAMPWKGEKDPYRIWLSEVILQQTRVEQGWAYYEKFVEAFPTIRDLARAPREKVFKLWEGLGYYSRCRNLIETAQKIDTQYNGRFPSTYEEILSLKGVGPYTAAAIASFAFNLPHAVVDGNVLRVLSRYFGNETPIDSTAGKKLYTELAGSLLDGAQPGVYNQAIMDFGAVVCKPQNPLCSACPQQKDCQARQKDWVDRLPVKEKSIRKKQRWFYYFIVEAPDKKVYIRKREKKDIWEDLYEFVLWETAEPIFSGDITDIARKLIGTRSLTVKYISKIYRQELSHQTIQGQFIRIAVTPQDRALPGLDSYLQVDQGKLDEYAFPKFINAWLQDPTPVQSLF